MIIKLTRKEIKSLIGEAGQGISKANLDEMAVPSYAHRNPLIKWLLWKRIKSVLRLANLNGTESVLDFGCGIGILLPTLCASDAKIHATDLFPGIAMELTKQRKLDVTFHRASHLDESLPDNTLDLIIAMESLEHLDEPGKYLGLFRKKLKSRGRMVISGPTENFVYKAGRFFAGFSGRGNYHRIDIGNLNTLITDCGFELLNSLNLPFTFPPYLFKILDYRKR